MTFASRAVAMLVAGALCAADAAGAPPAKRKRSSVRAPASRPATRPVARPAAEAPPSATKGPDAGLYAEAQRALATLEGSAARQAQKPEWENVILRYRRVIARYPQSAFADNALLEVGDLYRDMARGFRKRAYDDDAVAAYRSLVAEYPSSKLGEKALFGIAEIARDRNDRNALTDAVRNYLAAYPEGSRAKEAKAMVSRRGRVEEAALPSPPRPGLAQVFKLRFWTGNASTRVVLDVEKEVKFQQARISDPDRLWIDLDGTRLHPNLVGKSFPVGDGFLEKIRVAQRQDSVVRVVLDFKDVKDHSIFYLQNPTRLVIDVRGTPLPRTALVTRPPSRPPDPIEPPDLPPETVVAALVPPSPAPASSPTPSPSARPSPAVSPGPSPTPSPSASPTPSPSPSAAPAPRTAVADARVSSPPPSSAPRQFATWTRHDGTAVASPTVVATPSAVPSASPSAPWPSATAAPEPTPAAVLEPSPKPSRNARGRKQKKEDREREERESREREAREALEEREERAKREETARIDRAERIERVERDRPPATASRPPAVNRAGSYSLARQLGLGARTIVIDAGHGGHDPGSSGRNGLQEKDLVLDVALRLEKLIRKELGAEVIMTRATDVFIPLEERTAIANSRGADLFLSIHANSSRNAAARGIETYFLSFAQDPHAEAVAARENAVSAATMKDLQNLVKAITLNSKIDESRDFAASVQEAMVERIRDVAPANQDRGVRTAPFYVLIGANMPSVLAEISFVSNPQDEKLLRTPEHRDRIAESLFEGVRAYLGVINRDAGRQLTGSSRGSTVVSGARR